MASPTEPNPRKLHISLTLREDLYRVAQEHAKAEGLSVSALFERILLSMALCGSRSARTGETEALPPLRGILQGPWADLSKSAARSARHEELAGEGGK